jgi:predicted Zn-dependent protease
MFLARRARHALAAVFAAAAFVAPGLAAAQGQIRDTEIEEILARQSEPVLRASGIEPKSIRFILIADKEINAFAAPGYIGMNTGTILEAETPNQLLGVIAHEAGHHSGGHVARSGDMMRAGLRPFLLTAGLGVIAALAGAPDAAAGLLASSQYFGTLGALGYSRVQEGAADQAAATALDRAGYSGKGLAEFFEKFRYQEVFSEARKFSYFRSHPLSSDRIAALRRRVESLPNYHKPDSPEDVERHELMQAKIEAFLNPPQQTFIKYKETDTSFRARYARSIAYYRATEPDKALERIEALLKDQPDNPYLWELKGQVLFEFGRTADSEAPHRRSVELKPDAPLLRVNLAQSLIAQNDPAKTDEAIEVLRPVFLQEKDNAFAWRLLAQAYDSKQMPGQARLASAEYWYSLRDLKQAKVFAMRAREHLLENTPDWRRATDIVLASDPTDADLRDIARRDPAAVVR